MSEAAEHEDDFDLVMEGEEDVDLEVVDTTPDQDKGRTLLPADKEDLDEPDEDEVASYSDRVKKRISDATFKFHDQRRKREAAEREREEAVRLAKQVLEDKKRLEAALYQYEAGYVEQAKGRVVSELEKANAALRAAYEAGDPDAMAKAQAEIAKLSVAEEQYSRYQPRQVNEADYQLPEQKVQGPDPDDAARFQAFQQKNDWFQKDEDLTQYAMGIHLDYVSKSPDKVGSQEYYEDIEHRVKRAFPQKFGQQQARSTPKGQPVAGVSRVSTSSNGRKTVRLTKEQLALCRRLGVDPKDYAREYLKNGE